jgi:DNA repair protein RecN (Recombination protein N)
MLVNLSIKNYALIENVAVSFKDNLSTITGETGAGKSILLGALGLALGKRADGTTIKDSNTKCIIEAEFNIHNYNLESFFKNNELDFETNTIIRREILPSGKSRAFINDTPTTLQVLQLLSESLIDVHSQHQTLKLADENFQFKIVDALADNKLSIEKYKKELQVLKKLKSELKELYLNQKIAKEKYEYNLYLFEELKAAQFEKDEQNLIEQKLDKLNNIEEIKLNLSEALSISEVEEIGVKDLLTKFTNNLERIAPYSDEYNLLFERINSVKIEFDDIVNELEDSNETVDFNPIELENLNNRLQLIYNLQKKHAVTTIEDLLEIQEKLEVEVDAVQNSTLIISNKEKEVAAITKKVDELATIIYAKREKVIPLFIKKLEKSLSYLGMENTRFRIFIDHTNNYFQHGKDEIRLEISANKGINFGELKKIASGGEMSRIMLSVKYILSQYLKLPTIIFDEIDSGVSGDVSQKMADIMKEMSKNMQVISITHLPQIAAKGAQHYKVFKQDLNGNVVTQLKELNFDERVNEIAEMLSGKDFTQTAINHSRQLLN